MIQRSFFFPTSLASNTNSGTLCVNTEIHVETYCSIFTNLFKFKSFNFMAIVFAIHHLLNFKISSYRIFNTTYNSIYNQMKCSQTLLGSQSGPYTIRWGWTSTRLFFFYHIASFCSS